MQVVDSYRTYNVITTQDLEAALIIRHNENVNSFWLNPDTYEFPQLGVLVKGDLASLTFFPKADSAGFISVGRIANLGPGDSTPFPIDKNPGDDLYVRNDAVLPWATALMAAKEFFDTEQLPKSIEWREEGFVDNG